MAMKVYGPAASTNVARVLVCLEEVGAEYELVPVDMPSGEHKSPAHVARNYILRKGGSDLLRESNLSESAMVDVWLEVEKAHFSSAMSPIIFQTFVVPKFMGGKTDTKIVEENLTKLKTALEHKYLAGDFVSLADISHLPVLDAYPHVKAWIAEVMDRPSVKKVAELMKQPSA
ncbi:hypothetical protein HU200_057620 [Digitaria exilis]|uniref:glutathione transferase n=1 Tax=Digitaria exilis TaxID=1010633 RepID=A0A835E4V4_9POAL|nr:hypothetical protein HU200_057620 [Digitaria exilis]